MFKKIHYIWRNYVKNYLQIKASEVSFLLFLTKHLNSNYALASFYTYYLSIHDKSKTKNVCIPTFDVTNWALSELFNIFGKEYYFSDT